MNSNQTIVIGGGAAGLMAAGQAALAGARVTVLEKMKQPGRKIGISGKGRCNLTNTADIDDSLAKFGPNGKFLRQCFHRFHTPELNSFFESHGLALVTERGGRIFPASGKALDVVRTFKRWLSTLPVEISLNSTVEKLVTRDGRISGVVCNGQEQKCDRVILACGGASYPRTGSTGDGYRLAQSVGHTIVPIRPALVPLETHGNTAQRMKGLELKNVRLRVLIDGKRHSDAFGELLFTEHGVSGPVVLSVSGAIVDALSKGKGVILSIDTKPALEEPKLDARLVRDFTARAKEPLSSVLRGLLPREMVPICLQECQLDSAQRASQTTAGQRRRLVGWLKDFRLDVSGHRSFDEAIITAGGIALPEVDPRTMQSRIVPGLFLAGEVLDLQADTGGYNLMAAFSTGWLAGRSHRGYRGGLPEPVDR